MESQPVMDLAAALDRLDGDQELFSRSPASLSNGRPKRSRRFRQHWPRKTFPC